MEKQLETMMLAVGPGTVVGFMANILNAWAHSLKNDSTDYGNAVARKVCTDRAVHDAQVVADCVARMQLWDCGAITDYKAKRLLAAGYIPQSE